MQIVRIAVGKNWFMTEFSKKGDNGELKIKHTLIQMDKNE